MKCCIRSYLTLTSSFVFDMMITFKIQRSILYFPPCKVVLGCRSCIEINYNRVINVEFIVSIVSLGISNGVA